MAILTHHDGPGDLPVRRRYLVPSHRARLITIGFEKNTAGRLYKRRKNGGRGRLWSTSSMIKNLRHY